MANKIVPQTLNSSGVYDKLITAISSGGTGAESESAAVKNLISGLTSTSPASDDLIPFQDVSSGGAGKTTLSALASALQSVRGYAKIQTGSYVGTGTYGADNPCSLTFDVMPIYFQILGSNTDSSFNPTLWGSEYTGSGDWKSTGQVIPILDSSYNAGPGILGVYYSKSYDDWSYCKIEGHTLFWYNKTDSSYQYNSKNTTYYWIAF